jgi:hypothetical protein
MAASPTDAFYSRVAMFRLALDHLGGIYKDASILLFLGDEAVQPLPPRWKRHLGDNVAIHWIDPGLYRHFSWHATADARWQYDYDNYDIVILCDADTMLLRPVGEMLAEMCTSPAVMGVIAHYPFLRTGAQDYRQAWIHLAARHAHKPIHFSYRHTLIPPADTSESAACPFYLNFGFVAASPNLIRLLRSTYLSIRTRLASEMKEPFFSSQIALALATIAEGVPARALPVRYNFPNDVVAENLHPDELTDIRLMHYLRTSEFDRDLIFSTEPHFRDFLTRHMTGANRVFQHHVHQLTGGAYPFHF